MESPTPMVFKNFCQRWLQKTNKRDVLSIVRLTFGRGLTTPLCRLGFRVECGVCDGFDES